MDMRYEINVDLYNKEVTLFISTQFSYSINSFDFDGELEIPDRDFFITLANTIGMEADQLESEIYKAYNTKKELFYKQNINIT